MNEAFEKILERLDYGVSIPKMNGMERRVGKSQTQGFGIGVLFAKEIVKEVAKEYKGGWIPCSERLPDVEADVLLSLRSIDVHTGFMSNTEGYFYVDGEGYVEFENVLAWRPLPEPYKERD